MNFKMPFLLFTVVTKYLHLNYVRNICEVSFVCDFALDSGYETHKITFLLAIFSHKNYNHHYKLY